MEKFTVSGGNKITGHVKVSGAKNVAMKIILAGILTDKPIYVKNVPLITSVYGTADVVKPLGIKVTISKNHHMEIKGNKICGYSVPLELGGLYRTAIMVMGPLLARVGKAIVPNPGGCRLGRRPINWHIEGLKAMGAKIKYGDGYFHAEAKVLHGVNFNFSKNTHTGTESLILAAVCAQGEMVLNNASQEPEVDDLIALLSKMGAKIKRKSARQIVISGVKKLNGAEFEIMPDRNEVVTFAVGAIATGGNVVVEGAQKKYLLSFLDKLSQAGAQWKDYGNDKMRFSSSKMIKATNVTTSPHPGFMTDWQAPWVLLMTQAKGTSTVHETIYEDRFSYITELKKMGAVINEYTPKVKSPEDFYNFNWADKKQHQFQAIKIYGKSRLHNAVLDVMDLRAGATLVLAAAISSGESVIYGIDHIDRGYEKIENRLKQLNVKIKRISD